MQQFFQKVEMEHAAELKRCLAYGFETMDVIVKNMPLSIHFVLDDDFNLDIKAAYCKGIDIMAGLSDEAMEEIEKEVSHRQFAFQW